MSLENYSVYMPSYSIGDGVYDRIGEVCSPFGHCGVIIGGERARQAAAKEIRHAAEKAGIELTGELWYGGEASYENVEALEGRPEVLAADYIFAVGGGKALDTCKCLGTRLSKPVFTFPTIASTCAACTSVSIMYNADRTFKGPFFFKKPPEHAFINTRIIAEAPYKYMWAGMGDTYTKYFEATVSSAGEELPHYFELGARISSMCVEPVLRYGKAALEQNKAGKAGYELEQCVLAIVVTTAMASILLTLEHTVHYNSGLAHAVFYSLTAYPHIEERHLHGEVVGFGVLILLLCDKNYEDFRRIYDFNKSVGLPVSLKDIEITDSQLKEVLPAVLNASDIAHNPYKITEEMLTAAFDELEAYNNK